MMLRILALGLSLLAAAGCSLVNPFVIGPRTRVAAATAPPSPSMDLPTAKAYADKVKDEYREALGDQAKLLSWLGIGLIPLSAAAIGLGATGGPPSAVLATGLTGAAGFGVGTWLINKPRQAAYVAGIKAVSCAVDAVEPLGEINIASLHASLTTLETGIPALQRGIAVLTPLVGDLENDLKQVDQTAFAEHLKVLNEAKADLTLATSL